jgi:hypothetical protein
MESRNPGALLSIEALAGSKGTVLLLPSQS